MGTSGCDRSGCGRFYCTKLTANPKYHVLPYEDKASVKATKIVFIEPYTSVECEMAYLGKAEKKVRDMADLLKTLSMFDVRVKSLFIAARVWAEVCAIDEVDDGKLPAIAFPLLVTYFLQRCQEPVLPVVKIEDFKVMQYKLKTCPKTTTSVGELWFEFLKFYAVIFNWDENIVSITDLGPVSKSSKCMEKVWMYIEDPFDGGNIAKSVTNLDTANFIRACFDAFYNHRPSLCGSSGSVKGSEKWTYSFDSCDIYQYAPPECEDCAALGTGTCRACSKKEYVPVSAPLPELPDDSLLLKTADKVLHDVYNEYVLSESAIKGRKAFVEDLERYIQQRFKGAKLALFGSSVSGFGFNKSDLDINLTLPGNEAKEKPQQISILRNVMKHLRKNDIYKDIFLIPAEIPIVKFCYATNGWCGDISFGNSL
ncbi:terminal uridylyltransferase 7-like, partial [Uloborus diversus]|uniref:terminal uridylyltransferase 7-like n=2 Tax=Uloborus diversus TaxID=327109 RepID=UPI002409E849